MTAIAVSNLKGGVGKTTTVANLASAIGESGAHVLAVDLDGSAFALTRAFGIAPSQATGTTFEVMAGQAQLEEAVISGVARGVDLLPARRELASLELQLVSEMGRETVLARALSGHLAGYDTVLLDCPPMLSLLTVNALFAAALVLAPVALTDPGAVQGLIELRGAIERARSAGATCQIVSVARVKVDERRLASRAIDGALSELGLPIAQTTVPLTAAFDTAIARGRPLVVGEPDNRGSWAYRRLADELRLTAGLRAAA